MWNNKITALKCSILGYAMLVLSGCSTNPSNPNSPAQHPSVPKQPPDQGKKANFDKVLLHKPHTISIKRLSTATSPSTMLDKVVWYAGKQRGKAYCWGGRSPTTGFDCSGLTQYSFRQGAGISLPRTAAAQYEVAVKIPPAQARRGDLVFFRTHKHSRQVSHVGIYLGDNKFIHSPRTGKSITTSSLNGYWKRRLVAFGRIPGACRPIIPRNVA